MNEKDYEAIVGIIRKHTECKAKTGEFDTFEVAAEFTKYFKERDPQFDTDLFMGSCGFLTLGRLNRQG